MLYPLPIKASFTYNNLEVDLEPTDDEFIRNTFFSPIHEVLPQLATDPDACTAYCFPVMCRDGLPANIVAHLVKLGKQEILSRKGKIDKPIVVFIHSDSTTRYIVEKDVIIIRPSMTRQNRVPHEYAMPHLDNTMHESVPAYEPLPFHDEPKIGFCGFVNSDERKELIALLEKNTLIKTDFIKRPAFFMRLFDKMDRQKLVVEFKENMERNHFNVCCRGRGNFSMRFYEVMQAGRIPVLINSDMVLPFENEIDWDDVVIQGSNAEEVRRKLTDWSIKRDIVQQQIKARETWEKYLSIEAFYNRLLKGLKDYPTIRL